MTDDIKEKLVRAAYSPIDTGTRGLADAEKFMGQSKEGAGDRMEEAYNKGRYGDMLKASAQYLAANLAEYTAKNIKEGVASFGEIGGGSLLVNTTGGLSSLYGIGNRNDAHAILKIPEDKSAQQDANVESDQEAKNASEKAKRVLGIGKT